MNLIDLSEHINVVNTGECHVDAPDGLMAAIYTVAAPLEHHILHVVGPNIIAYMKEHEEMFYQGRADDNGVEIDVFALNKTPVLVNPRSDIITTIGYDLNGNLLATTVSLTGSAD